MNDPDPRAPEILSSALLKTCLAALLLVVLPADRALSQIDVGFTAVEQDLPRTDMRVRAEFETGHTLVLSSAEFLSVYPEILLRLIRVTRPEVRLIALVRDDENSKDLDEFLRHNQLPANSIEKVTAHHDTVWLRDYGPITRISRDGRAELLDGHYRSRDLDRPVDDFVPNVLGDQLQLPVRSVPLVFDGGNLLTNGAGLFLTSNRLFEENSDSPAKEDAEASHVRATLTEHFGATQVVVLEPLHDEATGHVDMFATFTSKTTVVVGRYTEDQDPVNAALLDRNAEVLRRVWTRSGSLRVVRVPMPDRTGDTWRTYTNVIFAGRKLIVPRYRECDSDSLAIACRTFRRLLPTRSIRTVDVESLAEAGGALHCASLNVPSEAIARRRTGRDVSPVHVLVHADSSPPND